MGRIWVSYLGPGQRISSVSFVCRNIQTLVLNKFMNMSRTSFVTEGLMREGRETSGGRPRSRTWARTRQKLDVCRISHNSVWQADSITKECEDVTQLRTHDRLTRRTPHIYDPASGDQEILHHCAPLRALPRHFVLFRLHCRPPFSQWQAAPTNSYLSVRD